GPVLAVRGLQRQAAGDAADFVTNLERGLCVSRNYRHRAVIRAALAAASLDDVFLAALDRWLEKLDKNAPLLVRALALLKAHETVEVLIGEPHYEAEYLV